MSSGARLPDWQAGARHGLRAVAQEPMMRWRGGLSLASKLRLLILGAVMLAAVLAEMASGISNLYSLRQSLAERLVTFSNGVAQSAAGPLQSHDHDAALEVLQSLRADRDVRAATLFDS